MSAESLFQGEKFLFLVRHGEARSKQEDPQRGLTNDGRAAVERLADWAARAGVRADQIRHSGIRRAEQTARILASRLDPASPVTAVSGLAPNDDVGPVASEIERERRTLMLVGHLPFLGRLASRLVAGDGDRPVVELAPAALAALVQRDAGWVLAALVEPGLLG